MIGVGGFWLMRKPSSSSPPFPRVDQRMDALGKHRELPVKNEATNLVAAMARLPAIAAKIAVLDSVCMLLSEPPAVAGG